MAWGTAEQGRWTTDHRNARAPGRFPSLKEEGQGRTVTVSRSTGQHRCMLFTKVLKLCRCSRLLEEQWVLISVLFDHLKTPKIRTATVPVLQSCLSSLTTAGGPWSLAQEILASLRKPMQSPKGKGRWEDERTAGYRGIYLGLPAGEGGTDGPLFTGCCVNDGEDPLAYVPGGICSWQVTFHLSKPLFLTVEWTMDIQPTGSGEAVQSPNSSC